MDIYSYFSKYSLVEKGCHKSHEKKKIVQHDLTTESLAMPFEYIIHHSMDRGITSKENGRHPTLLSY